jgi:hypothetical protein
MPSWGALATSGSRPTGHVTYCPIRRIIDRLGRAGSQSLDESLGVEALDAILQRKGRGSTKDSIVEFIAFPPVIKHSLPQQRLKQGGSEENGKHIRARTALLRNQSCIEARRWSRSFAFGGLAPGHRLPDEAPYALNIIWIDRRHRFARG